MADNQSSLQVSTGVQALIERLRQEGVDKGQAEAEQIVNDARSRAEWIVTQARQEADKLLSKAKAESDSLKQAGQEALNVAARDTVLTLKSQLSQRFAREVRRLVGEEAAKQELLQKLILEVAGRVKDDVAEAQAVEVLLPRHVVGLQELSRNSTELEEGILTYFVQLIGRDLLREGITFGMADDDEAGLRLRLVENEVVLDLSDRAIANVLLQHLQPRFRALLEGMVR